MLYWMKRPGVGLLNTVLLVSLARPCAAVGMKCSKELEKGMGQEDDCFVFRALRRPLRVSIERKGQLCMYKATLGPCVPREASGCIRGTY